MSVLEDLAQVKTKTFVYREQAFFSSVAMRADYSMGFLWSPNARLAGKYFLTWFTIMFIFLNSL